MIWALNSPPQQLLPHDFNPLQFPAPQGSFLRGTTDIGYVRGPAVLVSMSLMRSPTLFKFTSSFNLNLILNCNSISEINTM